ncbi:transposase [Nonomuraea angiospora]|uniref:transposase n=1 Tax=Nonomuraea angiospora TaxID=46172 RepID=UPI0033D3D68D
MNAGIRAAPTPPNCSTRSANAATSAAGGPCAVTCRPCAPAGGPPRSAKHLTVRRATHLITSHPGHLDENAALRLKKLLARCRELDAVTACVESFAQMMADLDGHRLPAWLEQAEATDLPPLKSLVNGVRQDLAAVTAGLSMQWNSGRVEGNVNRIKRIKRDGYGRASFDLLRLQILHAD